MAGERHGRGTGTAWYVWIGLNTHRFLAGCNRAITFQCSFGMMKTSWDFLRVAKIGRLWIGYRIIDISGGRRAYGVGQNGRYLWRQNETKRARIGVCVGLEQELEARYKNSIAINLITIGPLQNTVHSRLIGHGLFVPTAGKNWRCY